MTDTKEREAFEAWCKLPDNAMPVQREPDGDYSFGVTREYWGVWQASRRAERPAPEAGEAERAAEDYYDGSHHKGDALKVRQFAYAMGYTHGAMRSYAPSRPAAGGAVAWLRSQLQDIVEDCNTALNRDKRASEAELLGIRTVAENAQNSSAFDPGGLTADGVVAALRNIGFPVECGACMETFYTGTTTAEHNGHAAALPPPAGPDARSAEGLLVEFAKLIDRYGIDTVGTGSYPPEKEQKRVDKLVEQAQEIVAALPAPPEQQEKDK